MEGKLKEIKSWLELAQLAWENKSKAVKKAKDNGQPIMAEQLEQEAACHYVKIVAYRSVLKLLTKQ